MKDKYTPVPDTPVLIRAKRAYLNASDVSTPGAPTAASPWILCEKKTGKKTQWGTNMQSKTLNISMSPSRESPYFHVHFHLKLGPLLSFDLIPLRCLFLFSNYYNSFLFPIALKCGCTTK